jgi:TonB family protein
MPREPQLWKSGISNSVFASVPHTSARFRCQAMRPPEALATPNPLLDSSEILKVTVSFVIGTDGRVYSPLILESAGLREDRTVLQTVRSWRYRPAMCNGVPMETEGKIEFSGQ